MGSHDNSFNCPFGRLGCVVGWDRIGRLLDLAVFVSAPIPAALRHDQMAKQSIIFIAAAKMMASAWNRPHDQSFAKHLLDFLCVVVCTVCAQTPALGRSSPSTPTGALLPSGHSRSSKPLAAVPSAHSTLASMRLPPFIPPHTQRSAACHSLAPIHFRFLCIE